MNDHQLIINIYETFVVIHGYSCYAVGIDYNKVERFIQSQGENRLLSRGDLGYFRISSCSGLYNRL